MKMTRFRDHHLNFMDYRSLCLMHVTCLNIEYSNNDESSMVLPIPRVVLKNSES